MDVIRFGLSMRALRRRRRWTQARLASSVGVSRSLIGRIERGRADRVPVHCLIAVAAALGASISVRVLWHGEGLDRLLDADHASLTERMLTWLRSLGWDVATEVTFNVRGERGAIDILAFHEPSGSLLVVEIKSVVPDLQAMLGALDRKVRLAIDIARERGWHVRTVSRLLVLPDDRTARRRVDQHGSTFLAALPARTVQVRRWLRAPLGRLDGILFLSDAHDTSARQRVAGHRSLDRCTPRSRAGDRGRHR
ncbi:MAG TPA: helix-turn-helix transcriptional regulator [Candidatus Limnocylindrales bacterium]|nr:helix-turn-helix transcriptional regulator [Candidatus Limnocylindrales bacterium]